MNVQTMTLSKTGHKTLKEIDKFIDYWEKMKSGLPEVVYLKDKEFKPMLKSFGDVTPESIEYRGVRIELTK